MNVEPIKHVVITPAHYVLLPVANVMTGSIFSDISGFEKWIESR